MTDVSCEQNDWNVPCSDDENYGVNGKEAWEPSPTEIATLYDLVDREGVLELEWQCPGRRVPSPAQNDFYQEEDESLESK